MEYHPPLFLSVVAIEKGALESSSAKFVNNSYMQAHKYTDTQTGISLCFYYATNQIMRIHERFNKDIFQV